MSDYIPLSVPSISGNEWTYIKECLDTEWVSSAGKYVDAFESEFARATGTQHAIACVNGTAAIHVALQLAGVTPDSEVIAPTITFIAPINAIHYIGAHPVFMDADVYYNLSIEKTLNFLETETRFMDGRTVNRSTGRRIAAVLPVHVFGNAVDMEPLVVACRERNIAIVEDATESLGTRYSTGALGGRHAGTIGEIGCFSFNGNKLITTGGGGMIVTDDTQFAEKARYLTTQAKDDPVRYVHHEVGYNYRLTNIQAAMGVAQLENLQRFLAAKRENFAFFRSHLEGVPGLSLAETPPYAQSNFWFYALQVNPVEYGMDIEQLMRHLHENGIQSRPLWYPNHLQKQYRECQCYAIETALELHANTLNIPCSVNLSAAHRERVVEALTSR